MHIGYKNVRREAMGKLKKYITEKVSQWISYCREKWFRVAISVILFVILYGISVVNLGFDINKRTVIMTAICFAASFFWVVPRPPKWYSIPLVAIYLFYVPKKFFERIELPVHNMSDVLEGAALVNILIIVLVYACILLIFQNIGMALGFGSILLGVFAIINYYVVDFRGMALGYGDLFAAKTAMTVISSYDINMVPELWYSILYFIFFAAWGFWCGKPWDTKKIYHIGVSVVSVLYIAFFFFFWSGTDYLEEHSLKGIHWSPSSNQKLEGFLLSFAINVQESHVYKPVGYSEHEVQRIKEDAVNAYQSHDLKTNVTNPNIIFVMNESWSDLSVLGDIKLSESYMTTVDSLNDNAVKGNLHVSILGGLTANTEYEALTGNTMAFMPQNSVPYQLNVKQDIYSMARVLKEQGYECVALHPSIKTAWNRDKVYDYMGFDDFVDIYKFETDYDNVRGYISDKCTYDEIIYRYENKDEGTPLFMFGVTIQNHGGYGGGTSMPVAIESIGGKAQSECGDIIDAQTYVDLMQITDIEFARLIDYFENADEPTIICMFGDHQPSLNENFYNHVFDGEELTLQEQEAKKYVTPYVIWANYDVEFPELGDISANYLGAAVLECAGVDLPPYYKFLMELRKRYPIITRFEINDIKDNEMLKEYQILQYNHLRKGDGSVFGINPEMYEDFSNYEEKAEIPWHERAGVVYHALGVAPGGETLTNSYEALDYNYKRGCRVFEVDLSITSDNVVVLRHDWGSDLGQAEAFGWEPETEFQVPNAELFLNTPIYGDYTAMTLLDLYKFMDEKEDVYIILDPKYNPDVVGQFSLIVNTALDNGLEHVLERIVVQLYYEDMYEKVETVYSFDNYLYTLYYIGYNEPEKIGAFMKKNDIPVLVMPYTWIDEKVINDLRNYPVKIYVHTVNDVNEAKRVLDLGVDGIYTDMILEKEVDSILY